MFSFDRSYKLTQTSVPQHSKKQLPHLRRTALWMGTHAVAIHADHSLFVATAVHSLLYTSETERYE